MEGFLCWRVGRSEVMIFQKSDLEFISGMELYLEKLQSLPDEIAKKRSIVRFNPHWSIGQRW